MSPRSSRSCAIAAALLTTISAGCNSARAIFKAQDRDLPAASVVVRDPAPRPTIQAGQDLGIIAGLWKRNALENAARLGETRVNYSCVVAMFAGDDATFARLQCEATDVAGEASAE